MKDEEKTKAQLIAELHELRRQTAALARQPEETESIALCLTRFYFENTSIGIHQVAMDGRILNVNPYAADMLGYTTEELTALSIFDIDPSVHADTVEAGIKKFVTGRWDSFETVYLKKDGSKIPVEITGSLMKHKGQRYAFAFIKNITERKQMERALKKNEEWLSDLVSNVPGVVYQYKAASNSFSSSSMTSVIRERAIKMFGLDSDKESFFYEFVACLPEDDRDRFAMSINAAIDAQVPWHYEGQFTKPSGETFWFESNAIPRQVGHELAYYGVLTDITQRKEMESSLRFARYIVDKASVAIYRIDADGQILDANEQGCRNLGYTLEELCRLTVFDTDPDYAPNRYADLIIELRNTGARTIESRHLRKNGEIYPVQLQLNFVQYENQEFIVVFEEDITERKRAEDSLRLTQYIVDKAPIGIWRMGKDGEILDVNEQGCASLGYAKEELCRMNIIDFDPNFDPEVWEDNVASLKAAGTTIIESLHQRKNGEIFPIEVIQNRIRFKEQLFHVAFVQDITARKQSEEALRENEQLLVNILESMSEGITVLDHEFKFQIFNRTMENFTLTPKHEVLGKRPWDVFAYIRGSAIEKNIHKAMSGNNHGEIEEQISLPHKPDAWFRESSTPLKDARGQIVGVIEVVAEITRQKQDEEKLHRLIHELRESEARFKALHDASFGGITIHDKGLILECNQGLSEITGYSVDELIGMDGMLLFTEKSREVVMDRVVSGYEKPYEVVGVRKNGEEFPVRLAARNIPYKGKRARTVEFRDITEQKKAEAELRHLKNYLSNIIDSMPSVLVGVDRDGRVTQWNRRAQQTTGLSLEKVRAKPLEQVFPRLAGHMHQIETAIRECRVISSPKVSCKTGSEIRYENIIIFPLVENGTAGAVIRLDDVTEQVRLEEMMIQNEKMLSVGGLAAGMAHEINNPLAGMIQTANVMKTRLGDLTMSANLRTADELGVSIEKIRAFMEKRGVLRMIDAINESGLRMAEIVNNMLNFARKPDAAVSSCDPIQLVDRILDLAATDYDLKKQYDFKTIKIVKEYEKDLPMIPCEGSKIQQVLLNILRNGAQAMQDHNTDISGAPCFFLRLAREKNMLRIEIEDNGPGMDKTTQSRIFEPFFTTKPIGVGTGLGLSVSYFIITQNHGGTMDVISSPGKGSNFIIRLPLN